MRPNTHTRQCSCNRFVTFLFPTHTNTVKSTHQIVFLSKYCVLFQYNLTIFVVHIKLDFVHLIFHHLAERVDFWFNSLILSFCCIYASSNMIFRYFSHIEQTRFMNVWTLKKNRKSRPNIVKRKFTRIDKYTEKIQQMIFALSSILNKFFFVHAQVTKQTFLNLTWDFHFRIWWYRVGIVDAKTEFSIELFVQCEKKVYKSAS